MSVTKTYSCDVCCGEVAHDKRTTPNVSVGYYFASGAAPEWFHRTPEGWDSSGQLSDFCSWDCLERALADIKSLGGKTA